MPPGAFEAAGGCPVTNILSFDIHPNAEGHALLAKLTLEAVEKNRRRTPTVPRTAGENMGGDRPDGGDRDGNSPDNTPTTAPDSEEKDSVTVSAGNAPSPGETGVGNETARPDGGDAAPDGKGGKAILCILLSAVSAAGCAGVVLLYKSHRRG